MRATHDDSDSDSDSDSDEWTGGRRQAAGGARDRGQVKHVQI